MIKLNRMYGELAHLYPLISRPGEYAREANYWRDALRAKLGPGRHEILELGAGAGHNLSHLKEDFQITATDLSAEMLEHCKKLNPDVPVHVGDMRSIRLCRTFKAVLIHDAINYMLTTDDLRQTFRTAAAHLEPDGVLIVAADHFRETFHGSRVHHYTNSEGETELTVIEYHWEPDPADTTVEVLFFYLIRTREGLREERDRHVMGLFPVQTWLDLMGEAGFAVETFSYPVFGNDGDGHPGLLAGTLQGKRSA